MKKYLLFSFRFFLAWILIFFIQRILFISVFFNGFKITSLANIPLAFLHGLIYDLSTTCYIFLPVLVLASIHAAGWMHFPKKLLFGYNLVILFISSLINSSDIGIFRAWGTKLNERALSYLAYPKEILGSVEPVQLCLLIALLVFQFFIGMVIIKKISLKNDLILSKKILLPLNVIMIFLMIIGIRGGFQKWPISKSRSYFSVSPLANYSAINGSWNVIFDLTHLTGNKNKYIYLPSQQAKALVTECMHSDQSETKSIFNTQRPNIVFIQLESWNADLIEALEGEKDVTPEFSKLVKEGLLFQNFYASGFRTEQGLVSIISGFPSQPQTSIIRYFGKFDKLPSMVKSLDSIGFSSISYMGGDPLYANTISYLTAAGFQKVKGENAILPKAKTVWGAYDEDLFNFVLSDTISWRKPFLTYITTVTSHEPFNETPGNLPFKGGTMVQNYRNAIHYTDACLGHFFEKAKHAGWYSETIFILVADHSHGLPKNRTFDDAGRFRIPMLIFGEPLKNEFRGTKLQKFGSQQDIPATLLAQIQLPYGQFRWSKNLFKDASPSFAYFTFENGFGMINENGNVIFDNSSLKTITSTQEPSSEIKADLLLKGKAIQQEVQEEFIKN